MALQKTTNGGLLRLTNGNLQKSCCCGGTSPSTCPDADPEVYLTIFDADYAGGNITWCGEVWSQTDVQNGAEKGPVCPGVYFKGQTSAINPYVGRNTWKFTNSLTLRRAWSGFSPNSNYPVKEQNLIRIDNTKMATYRKDSISLTLSTFQIGVLTAGVSVPTFSSYAIVPNPLSPTTLDVFFGNYTESGIQYSWRRGNGW